MSEVNRHRIRLTPNQAKGLETIKKEIAEIRGRSVSTKLDKNSASLLSRIFAAVSRFFSPKSESPSRASSRASSLPSSLTPPVSTSRSSSISSTSSVPLLKQSFLKMEKNLLNDFKEILISIREPKARNALESILRDVLAGNRSDFAKNIKKNTSQIRPFLDQLDQTRFDPLMKRADAYLQLKACLQLLKHNKTSDAEPFLKCKTALEAAGYTEQAKAFHEALPSKLQTPF